MEKKKRGKGKEKLFFLMTPEKNPAAPRRTKSPEGEKKIVRPQGKKDDQRSGHPTFEEGERRGARNYLLPFSTESLISLREGRRSSSN